jgi:hypothetical protein
MDIFAGARERYDRAAVEFIEALLSDLPEDVAKFRQRHPYSFLVRRPVTIFQTELEESNGEIEYRTVTVEPESDGIAPWEWWIAPLTKRPGNPFPDHLSVGRAPNCDVVMRFNYVSKLHARFHLKGGDLFSLEDRGSSNGTGVNGQALKRGVPIELRPGDKLSFGSLVVMLMRPEDLYSLLHHRRNTSRVPPRSEAGQAR